jgi:colicin import membrane protein
MAVEG